MSAPRFRLVQGRAIGERPTGSSSGTPQPVLQNPISPENQPQLQQLPVPSPRAPSDITLDNQSPASVQSIQSTPLSTPLQTPGPPTPAAVPVPSPAPAQARPGDENKPVVKCIRFLKTLLNLSNNPNQNPPNTEQNANPVLVRQLISNVIYGDISAEEFTGRLQQALNSQAQPHLLPFLQNTIPALRTAVRNGEVTVDGINPPPGFVFNNRNVPPPPQPIPIGQSPVNQQSQLKSRLSAAPQMPPMHHGQHVPQQVVVQRPPQPMPQHVPLQQQPSTSHQNNENRPEEEIGGTRVFAENSLQSALLSANQLMNRITKRMKESCLVEEEALTLISDAAESHLRELIVQIAGIAEHRADSVRVPDHYIPIDDTKRQLKFLEEVDRQEEEMREIREKEALIRMSKNKNTGKETVEKAKEMQRVDAEAKRNRDANAAAIAALSGNKTVKSRWEGSSTAPSANQRQRTIRVTTRDLHVVVNSDCRFHGTFLREKLSYGTASETNI